MKNVFLFVLYTLLLPLIYFDQIWHDGRGLVWKNCRYFKINVQTLRAQTFLIL
jgi:hypothetical protein